MLRRAHPQGDGVVPDGVYIPLLAHGFGLDGFPLGGDAEDVGGQGLDLVLVAGLHQLDQIADVLLVDGLSPGGEESRPWITLAAWSTASSSSPC